MKGHKKIFFLNGQRVTFSSSLRIISPPLPSVLVINETRTDFLFSHRFFVFYFIFFLFLLLLLLRAPTSFLPMFLIPPASPYFILSPKNKKNSNNDYGIILSFFICVCVCVCVSPSRSGVISDSLFPPGPMKRNRVCSHYRFLLLPLSLFHSLCVGWLRSIGSSFPDVLFSQG